MNNVPIGCAIIRMAGTLTHWHNQKFCKKDGGHQSL